MATSRVFADVAEAELLPKLVRLGDNLFGAVFSLMKSIPARFILRKAIEDGQLKPDTVIIETTSGTFGLALARQTALLGRGLILVSDPVIDLNLRRQLEGLGAEVEIVTQPAERGGFQQSRLDRVAEIRAELPDSFCPEQYSNPDNARSYAVVAGLLRQTLGPVGCVVGPVGSGGSMCGTVGELRRYDPETFAIGVDTHRSMLFGPDVGPRQLRGLGNSLMPANLDHTIFDEVHWCTAAEAYASTRWAHRRRALFQGPTSGAALLVARWWARRNSDRTCVVLLPDAGHRYLETVYNDAWLGEHGFARPMVPEDPVELVHPKEHSEQWSRFPWSRRRFEDLELVTAGAVQ